MQGYIIHTQKLRDEDLIVEILTKDSLVKTYRFYGARHSNIMLGYKIDFELISNLKFLPQLRSVMHLGFKWLHDRNRLIVWQQFANLLYKHLKDAQNLDNIYFDIIENMAYKFNKTNPKRVVIEAYIEILFHEGRLNKDMICFICDEKIDSYVSLVRGFLPSHKMCSHADEFNINHIKNLFEKKESSLIDDSDINRLYDIILQGL